VTSRLQPLYHVPTSYFATACATGAVPCCGSFDDDAAISGTSVASWLALITDCGTFDETGTFVTTGTFDTTVGAAYKTRTLLALTSTFPVCEILFLWEEDGTAPLLVLTKIASAVSFRLVA
jgi:hypothetical protein